MGDKQVSKIPGSIAKLNEEAKADSAFMDNVRVLVDRSASMEGPFANGGAKYTASQQAMDLLYSNSDWSICNMKVWGFDDYIQEVPCDEAIKPKIPAPRGGTDFSGALKIALEDSETTRIILCSDGEASYPETEVASCIERSIPIDTIYIKSTHAREEAEQLLQRISEETGGQFCTVDTAEALMQAFAALETSERLLLSHQPEEDSVIKL